MDNIKYQSNFGTKFTPYDGEAIDISGSVYVTDSNYISQLVNRYNEEELYEKRRQALKAGDKIVEEITDKLKEWEKCAAEAQACRHAIEFLKVPVAKHSNNKWEISDDYIGGSEYTRKHIRRESISNMTYKLNINIAYDKSIGWDETKYLRWRVYGAAILNTPITSKSYVVCDFDREFWTREEAYDFVEEIKYIYADWFKSISPPVGEWYEHFSIDGVLLPGYH